VSEWMNGELHATRLIPSQFVQMSDFNMRNYHCSIFLVAEGHNRASV